MLVVEDEHRLGDRLVRAFAKRAWPSISHKQWPWPGISSSSADYDLVLLDLKLLDGSGLELLAEWRADGCTAHSRADREGPTR
jgi:DNA-binding response OmpR family regulator